MQKFVEDASVYQEKDEITHILLRPDILASSIDHLERKEMLYNFETKKINYDNVTVPKCLIHIFKEAIGNVLDNIQRSRKYNVDPKKVEITITDNSVCVKNYGTTIPIVKDPNGIYIPEGVFGHLRYGQNFDDDIERTVVGKNGVGIKLANIFSKEFIVKVKDGQTGELYTQKWTDHMRDCGKPKITKCKGDGFVEITYFPDFEYFKMEKFDEHCLGIHAAYTCMAAFTSIKNGFDNVPFFFNKTKFNIPSIQHYVSYFIDKSINYFVHSTDDYQLCVIDTPNNSFNQSFVNGMVTVDGGVHLDLVANIVTNYLKTILENKMKGIGFSKKDIDKHISIFISCTLDKPKYREGQSKDCLISPKPKIILSEDILSKMKKWNIMEAINEDIQSKQLIKSSKTDGKNKNRRIIDIDNLIDSNWAGNKEHKHKTTLMIFEGKSAKEYRINWMECLPNHSGNDLYGGLSLHGKLINVLKSDFDKLYNNRDIIAIKKALGLQEKLDYRNIEDIKTLRYGRVLLAPDADNDGIHISCLMLTYFCTKFEGLVLHGIIYLLRTPVVRAVHKKTGQYIEFLNLSIFLEWCSKNDPKDYDIKYYKGLGTSTLEDTRKDVENPHIIQFKLDEQAIERIKMAFGKMDKVKKREWFYNWTKSESLDMSKIKVLPITDYINHELPLYVVESVIRAIPNIYDGLKDAQRKALFAAKHKLKSLKAESKVEQIANYASDITCYKHGSSSLAGAIIHMALDFTGTNNLSYFVGHGSFGSLESGVEGVASPRYVSISLSWWLNYVYKKQDELIMKYVIDEGEEREYETYYPIIPLHLINKVSGIAKVVSTAIPAYNPQNVSLWLQTRIRQKMGENIRLPSLKPWYRGFNGEIKVYETYYLTIGKFHVEKVRDKINVIVTCLPVGTTNAKYKEKVLKDFMLKDIIADYKSKCGKNSTHFILENFKGEPTLENLKLISRETFTNMNVVAPYVNEHNHMANFTIKHYNNVDELINDFYELRLVKYYERKDAELKSIREKIDYLKMKLKFVKLVVDGKIKITDRNESELEKEIEKYGFDIKLLDNTNTRSYNIQGQERIQNDIIKHEELYKKLYNTIPEKIWYDDLEEFIVEYCKRTKEKRTTVDDYPELIIEKDVKNDYQEIDDLKNKEGNDCGDVESSDEE